MIRFSMFCLCATLVASTAFVGQSSHADGKGDLPSIEDVMKSFSGKGNVHKLLRKAVDAEKIDWEDAAKLMKKYSDTAVLIGKYGKVKPEKGAQAGWTKLCDEFAKQSKELEAAVGKKDKDASKTMLSKLNDTCEKCHEDHR
jgi:cytochrome c556